MVACLLTHVFDSVPRITPGDYGGAMGQQAEVAEIPIEKVENGWTVIDQQNGQQVIFQVERRSFNHKPPGPMIWTLESADEPPLRKEAPAGTICQVLVKLLDESD